MSTYSIQDSNALLLYKVGPVHVCSSAMLVESVIVPPELNVLPGSDSSGPGIFKSIHGMVRVVDLRVRFGVDKSDFLDPGRIIVVNIDGGRVGFHVDEIEDVAGFPATGWKDVPAQIPREVFSRTLLKESLIRLYADFEALDRFKATGYLRKHIEQLKKIDEKPVENSAEELHRAEKSTRLSSGNRNVASAGFVDSTRRVPEKLVKPQAYKPPVVEKKVTKEAETFKSVKVEKPEVSRGPVSRSRKKAVKKSAGVDIAAWSAKKEEIATCTKIENKVRNDKAAVNMSVERPDRNSINYRGKEFGENDVGFQQQSSPAGLIWAVLIVPVLVAMVYFWSSLFDEKLGEEERAGAVQKTVDLYDTEKKISLAQKSEEIDSPGVKPVLSERIDIEKAAEEQEVVSRKKEVPEPALGKATDEIELQEKVDFAVIDAESMGEGEKVEKTVAREEVLEVRPTDHPTDYSGYSPREIKGEPGDVVLIKNNRDIVIVVNELPEEDLAAGQKNLDAELSGVQDKQAETGISSESGPIRKRHENKGANIESSNGADALELEKTQVDKPVEKIKIEGAALPEPVLRHVPEVNENIKIRKYIHIVVKGDTLWDIAGRYVNNPWRYPELARLSNIKNPDLIYPGNKVIVIIQSR